MASQEGPSAAYLAQSQEPSSTDASGKKLLILDLNGTILYRTNSSGIRERPFLQDFLKSAFEHFVVMVWSSAQPVNVDRMVNRCMSGYRKKLVAVWARDTLDLGDKYYHKVQTIKNLEKVWRDPTVQAAGPFGYQNTIVVDDSTAKCVKQPFNHILVQEFQYARLNQDDELQRLGHFLETVREQSNVAHFLRHHPFTPGQHDHHITDTHEGPIKT